MTKSGLSQADEDGRPADPAPAQGTNDAPPKQGARPPSRRRRLAKRTAHSVGLLVGQAMTLALILLFALLIRLQGAPLDISIFAPTIEAAINRSLSGRIEIGGVSISTHRESDEPRLLLQDVTLRNADERVVFSAPSFAARFDPAQLLSGRFAPTSVTLIGPTAVLTRAADGSFSFGIGGPAPAASPPTEASGESPMDAFSTFAAGLAFPERRRDPFTALDSIAVRDAFLVYRDEMSGRVWRAPNSFLRVWAGNEGARAFARITLSQGDEEPTQLTLTGRRLRAADRVFVRAGFERLSARDLADQIPFFDWMRATDGVLDGGLDLQLAPDGGLLSLSGALRADSVVAEVAGEDRLLDFADASFSLNVAENSFRIARLEASALGVTGEISAHIKARRDEAGALAGAEVTLDSLRATIARPDQFDEPVQIREGRAEASIDLGETLRVTLPEAEILAVPGDLPAARIGLSGDFTQTASGLGANVDATVADFGIKQVIGLWPKALSTNGRQWVHDNIPQGVVHNTRAQLRMAPGGDPEAVLDFEFSDALSTYLGDMPPLIDGRGKAGIRDEMFHLELDSGAVETADGVLDISGSTLEIRNLLSSPAIARPTIRGTGAGAAVLNIIEHEPLRLPSKLGIAPSDVAGDVVATATLEFPLLKALSLSDVLLDLEARVTALTMAVPNTDLSVTADEVALTADQTGMTVTGDARVDGHPARVTWRERFVFEDGPRRTLTFATRYSSDDAVAAGAPRLLFPGGEAAITGAISFSDDAPTRIDAKADLTKASLQMPDIGWRKEAGLPGALALNGDLIGERGIGFDLDTPGLDGEGTLRFLSPGMAFDIRRAALQGVGEFSGRVTTVEDKIDVALTSPSVDLERFLSETSGASAGLEGPEVNISLNADGAHLTGSLWAGSLSSQITIKGGEKRATFNGLINGDAPFTGDFTGAGEESRLSLRSDEAGRALKALNALQSGRGGKLKLDLLLAGAEAPIEGAIHIDNLVVTEAPVLAEMLSLASLVGAVDKLTSGGVTFTTIEANFRAERSQLYISNAAAYGPTVGMTAQGSYDLEGERFDLSGSISPAYVINGLVNAVPLLGEALTGGEGEGIFGIAYELKGPADDPQISVNPLSVLAIGPFRRLFSGSSDPDAGGEDDVVDEETWRERQRKRRDAFD